MTTRRKTFAFSSEQDRELLTWLDAQANASAVVRQALWAYYRDQHGPTLSDIYHAVQTLTQQLADAPEYARNDYARDDYARNHPVREDPQLAAALDNLGL
jgi:hypothetical protein